MAQVSMTLKFKEEVSETIRKITANFLKVDRKQDEIKKLLHENSELMVKCIGENSIEIK